ncbi:MAG: hypothetical protein J0I34_00145 [Pseudonocardia sp.]|uniref:hypothetical protein n=1 Tax=unclassified Pseudonocardia TaxID=2619320 RepID=UPI00086A9C6D|nr:MULTISPECIES: hypothetical protein [unclassified Pseudonocardia]MBN9107166.1 hypothetical protein [Pseudonocardia sp.]ODU26352.1 MAG: hypothetical protein ABS80_07285 [Pseudonocardia sp. SCN 72-51]ODV02688.1 MAG: hypothetical protein ABT15_24710 [Pseudonocardia sp. SCN 73-27]
MSRREPFDLCAVLADDALLDALGPRAESDARIRARFGDDVLVETLLLYRGRQLAPTPRIRVTRRFRPRATVVAAALIAVVFGLGSGLDAGIGPPGPPTGPAAHTVDRYLKLAAANLASGDHASARVDVVRAGRLLGAVRAADARSELEARWVAIDRAVRDTTAPLVSRSDRVPENREPATGAAHSTSSNSPPHQERQDRAATSSVPVPPHRQVPVGTDRHAALDPPHDPPAADGATARTTQRSAEDRRSQDEAGRPPPAHEGRTPTTPLPVKARTHSDDPWHVAGQPPTSRPTAPPDGRSSTRDASSSWDRTPPARHRADSNGLAPHPRTWPDVGRPGLAGLLRSGGLRPGPQRGHHLRGYGGAPREGAQERNVPGWRRIAPRFE